jgi:hypothetical protein
MHIFPLPKWLKNMPNGPDKNRALNRFYLRLACLYATREGLFYHLADLIEINRKTFNSQVASKVVASTETRYGIIQLLGPSFVPPDFPKSIR